MSTTSAPPPEHPDNLVLLDSTRRALTRVAAAAQADGRAPSLTAAVARGPVGLWAGGAGSVDGEVPDPGLTAYRIGSLTKTFTAVLVMRLRAAGRLELHDPVAAHLPGADLPEAVAGATVAQLLAHSSGLAAETPPPWWERTPGELRPTLAEVFREPAAVRPAGVVHHYSNTGYAVLGALVERAHGGTPWAEVLRAEVLEPLGLRYTGPRPAGPHAPGWAVHPYADAVLPEAVQRTGVMAPAGELWSTAGDLMRWAGFLLDGDPRVLDADAVAELRQPAVPPAGPDWGDTYGLGMRLLRTGAGGGAPARSLAGHTGSVPGFLAALWIDPEERLAAAVLADATAGPAVSGTAVRLLEETAGREPRIPAPWRPMPEADADPELLALTGTWYWGPSPFTLTLRAGRRLDLAPAGGQGRASRFVPAGPDAWTGLDGYWAGESLTLRHTPAPHLDLGSFTFTRAPYQPEEVIPGGVSPKGWTGEG